MDQTSKNDKKSSFGPVLTHLAQIWGNKFFLQVLPLLVIRYCFELSSNAIIKEN